jgi:hypothetical protein
VDHGYLPRQRQGYAELSCAGTHCRSGAGA